VVKYEAEHIVLKIYYQ